jgi:type III pantothenate kinase
MNLLVDIGNTRTKVAITDGDTIVESKIFSQLQICDIEWVLKTYPPVVNCILSSTAADDLPLIEYLNNTFKLFINLTGNTALPFKNLYQTKETQGADRIAGIAGAQYLNPNANSLIIDAGTAITFDFINDKGEYLGGTISPGMQIRFKALNTFTGKLPLLQSVSDFNILGKNTNEAIVAGVQNGIIFEIDGYISNLNEQYHDLKVFLTGGDAEFFANKLKNTIFVNQNLLLIGLNRILEYNAKK